MAMVWNMVFSMIGGLKTIPQDINDAAKVFGAKGFKKLIDVTLPSIFPSIITGSFLAWGQGWNISIVAEALHAFIPNGTKTDDLFGLGSLLVNSFSQSKNAVFFASLAAMVVVITLFNFFIWQKLLHLSERYKFD
jgi:NitT/TauT family transport system permease protein